MSDAVTYTTDRAQVTIHIPEQSNTEAIQAALIRFYQHITARGYDWDALTKAGD